MDDKTKSRKWLLTFNNPLEHQSTHKDIKQILLLFKGCTYWCMCDEVGGKQKTYHTHLFIYAPNPIRFQTVKKRFPTAHIDFCRGTCEENRDYIRKEGKYKGTDKEETNLKDTFEELGEVPEEHQGKRNDLETLYMWIKEGLSNYEILEENPNYMLDIDKVEKCREIIRYEQFKKTFRQLDVCYQYGVAGIGKSRSVTDKYGLENVYRITNRIHPWDNYKGQDVVVFEEFRSTYPIEDMLNFLDGYPLDLPCRYNNKVACYTKVYICTNIPLEQQYTDIQRQYPETWLAFLRRLSCIKEFNENGIKSYENIQDYLERWQPVSKKEIEMIYKQEMMDLKKGK
ncbi:MAG: replication protein [Lachnospiraceae bacterium]|nr:replication protein [Lachnospiraceae bacterium]